MATVKAVVFTGDGKHDVREFPMPEPPEGGLVLRVEAVGLCGSDLAQLDGQLLVPNGVYPVVPGHETVGRIERMDAGAAWTLAVGDRVAVDEILRCGRCAACRGGELGCRQMQLYGYTLGVDDGPGLWGGYGEYMAILPGTNLLKLPGDVPAEELTLFEPLANALNWTTLSGIKPGDTVVVEGPGHQGLACVVAAHLAGAVNVIATGRANDGLRLEAALTVGASHTIDVDNEDPVARVAEITGGAMADVVMDIADGSTATVTLAIEMAKSRGRVLLAGLKHSKPVQNFVSDTVVFKSLTIVGGSGFTPGSMRASVDLLAAGRIPTKELLGGVFTIDQIDQAIAYLSRSVPGEDRVRVGLRFD